jgi:TDG/mug DNA glycosylase family protein
MTFLEQGLPDIVASGLDILFCGINPGLRAAASGHHFDGKGNRFWHALYLAGITPILLSPTQDRSLLDYHCGLTTAVRRPTRGADNLGKHEILAAGEALIAKVGLLKPRCVAFLGKTVYAALADDRSLEWGLQPDQFGETAIWLLPNPSGRNRAFTLDALVTAYRQILRVKSGNCVLPYTD